MPRRKQARRTSVKDIRSILRLTRELGLSVREVADRLKLSKTSVSTYLLRAREAGLSGWPLPAAYEDDAALERLMFHRVGRPPQDLGEPDWAMIARALKRKGVTLTLLWQEYRTSHPDGYGYTWFWTRFAAFQRRASPSFRNRHEAGAVVQTDYAGHTLPIIDPQTGVIVSAQIFVAVLGASSLTFAFASFSQKLPDWIEGQCRALNFFGGVPKAIVCDNLKAGVAKPLWFEPTLNPTFAAMAAHYDTTILPTRSRKPRDKGKVEGAVLIVERWILARLRNRHFHTLGDLNAAIAVLLEDRRLDECPGDNPLGHLRAEGLDPRGPGLVAQQAVHALLCKPFLPAPDRRLALGGGVHDRHRAQPSGGGQHDPGPPDMLLRAVAVCHDGFEPITFGGRHFNDNPGAHPQDSHSTPPTGIPFRTPPSHSIH